MCQRTLRQSMHDGSSADPAFDHHLPWMRASLNRDDAD
jgi:hypothetical protein